MFSSITARNAIVCLSVAAFLVACGGRKPDPVAQYKIGDDSLTCNGIKAEMAHIDSQVDKLIPESKKGAKNVALGVTGWFLIVPWFFMDFSDAERVEIKAYQERYLALQQLADQKGCNGQVDETLQQVIAGADGENITNEAMAESVSASLDADDQEVLGEAPSVAPSNGVGEKLALLDDLHKQGLISDEEYASRRQAILDAALE